jgi:hypothetical protein
MKAVRNYRLGTMQTSKSYFELLDQYTKKLQPKEMIFPSLETTNFIASEAF